MSASPNIEKYAKLVALRVLPDEKKGEEQE
jgi:hypothetical protein